jgi:hypothetical protein
VGRLAHSATGLATPEVDSFIKASVFATLTNVNFDPQRFRDYITTAGAPPGCALRPPARPRCAPAASRPLRCAPQPASRQPPAAANARPLPLPCPATPADAYRDMIVEKLRQAGVQGGPSAAQLPWFDRRPNPIDFSLASVYGGRQPGVEELERLGDEVSLLHRKAVMGEGGQATLLGLHELLTYGLKGVAAYAHHAEMLGQVRAALRGSVTLALGACAGRCRTPERA